MKRQIKIILQYDGTNYAGWQVQKKEKTIQHMVEDALCVVTGERIKVIGAGRTDAGVHALEQVAAFKTHSSLAPEVFMRAINANLPHDIRVSDASECSMDFHPRYSAKKKTYSYIVSFPGEYSVFLMRYSWVMPYQLSGSIGTMKKAADVLLGEHDFSCFRASGCSSKNQVRCINKIDISESPSVSFMNFIFHAPVLKVSIQANAFLRHMVRNIVGTLIEVGRGKISPINIKEILYSRDRCLAGPTAPAQGLFLEEIEY
jgi:tRNA pseudouridine38-40 synthase